MYMYVSKMQKRTSTNFYFYAITFCGVLEKLNARLILYHHMRLPLNLQFSTFSTIQSPAPFPCIKLQG